MNVDIILAAARACVETPFRHQGRLVGLGLDCAGVIDHVARRLGHDHTAPTNYPRLPYQGLLEATLDEQPCLERVTDLRPGDVLLMRFGREPQHLAIYAGATIIHAYEAAGKCCEHDYTAEWQRRTVRIYRFKDHV
jgi:cell wall-associated NlpC family hydrolase